MATWMEIRCDVNAGQCWSSVNAGPMQMAGDTQATVIQALRDLHADARKQGWKRIDSGWACPNCGRD